MVLPFEYDTASEFSQGIACVKQNGKYLFVNKEGKKVFPEEFNYATGFTDGLAVVEKEGKYGCLNKDGKIVIPEEYDEMSSFKDGYACARKNNKFGVINKIGKVVIPFEYDMPININLKEGLTAVVKNRKYGFVDHDGILILPCIYDYAQDFANGLAKVTKGKRTGLIDKVGNSTFDYSTDKQKAIEAIEQNYFNTDYIPADESEKDGNSKKETVKKLSDTNLFLIGVNEIYEKQYFYVTVAQSLDYIQKQIDETREKIMILEKKYKYAKSAEAPIYRDNALRAKKRFFDVCDDYGRKLNGGIVPKWK
jgi:hypothetical protein